MIGLSGVLLASSVGAMASKAAAFDSAACLTPVLSVLSPQQCRDVYDANSVAFSGYKEDLRRVRQADEALVSLALDASVKEKEVDRAIADSTEAWSRLIRDRIEFMHLVLKLRSLTDEQRAEIEKDVRTSGVLFKVGAPSK